MSDRPDEDTWRQLEVDATTPFEFDNEDECEHDSLRRLTPRTAYCYRCGCVVPSPVIRSKYRDPEMADTVYVDLCTPYYERGDNVF